MNIATTFLNAAIKKFNQQKALCDKAFAQLDEKDFFFKPSPASNSIAVIVQHMHGNMLSRWTNFLIEDGEKSWRKRDEEFEEGVITTKQELINKWEEGWKLLLNVLNSLKPEDIERTITIRNEPLTVVDAIIRQLDHYGYHVGQILYIAKLIKNEDWISLSIPLHQSKNYKP